MMIIIHLLEKFTHDKVGQFTITYGPYRMDHTLCTVRNLRMNKGYVSQIKLISKTKDSLIRLRIQSVRGLMTFLKWFSMTLSNQESCKGVLTVSQYFWGAFVIDNNLLSIINNMFSYDTIQTMNHIKCTISCEPYPMVHMIWTISYGSYHMENIK